MTDSSLVSLYQNGNEKALEILIDRHQKDLFSFIYYKVLNDDLSNDIFQDTFLKIIVTLKQNRYNEEGKFILWAKNGINSFFFQIVQKMKSVFGKK